MDIEIKRSDRKTVAIEVKAVSRIILRLPNSFPEKEIPTFLEKYSSWIEKCIEKQKLRSTYKIADTPEEIYELKKRASEILPSKVEHYSQLTGLVPTGIKITSAKKRFGSCSNRNSLCFSYQLMKYSDSCIDYVVLHEIAHIKHHNHSKAFYAFIEKYMPDYKERVKILRSTP